MALILNLETSTTNCSVSLAEDGKLIAIKEDNNLKYSHSESLHVFIDEILKAVDTSISDIKAIAVSEGPGSYTGLRIGVSAAKGLCYALNVPLISISTLRSLALQVNVEQGFVIPMLDARRMEVYASIYNFANQEIKAVWPEIITETSFAEYLEKDQVFFVGNTNEKVKPQLNHPNANFLEFSLPSSKEMVSLSYQKFKNNEFEDVAYFEPKYLKAFKAN